MASLGQICIVGAFGLALYAIVSSIAGVRVRNRELTLSGQHAAWAVTGLITAASVTLLVALAVHDFSLRYVWEHSSRAMSMDLVLAAFYSGQQGSLLYWAWTLSIFSAIVLWQQRRPGPHRVFMPYVVAVLMVVEAFMTLLLGFIASPFEALPRPPADGVGLNPLLYDPGMRIHPPMLLAGLMSWSVPFAFAIAALATGKLDNDVDRGVSPLRDGGLGHPRPRQHPRRLVGVPRAGLGRLLGLGPGRERGAHALAGRDGIHPQHPDAGTARHAQGVEPGPDHGGVLSEHLRHVRRSQRDSGVRARVRPVGDRALLPDVPGAGHRRLAVAVLLAAPAPAFRQSTRLAPVARGEFSHQQSAVPGHRLCDLLGNHLSAGRRGGRERESERRPAVLQAGGWPATGRGGVADGHRAAHALATCLSRTPAE